MRAPTTTSFYTINKFAHYIHRFLSVFQLWITPVEICLETVKQTQCGSGRACFQSGHIALHQVQLVDTGLQYRACKLYTQLSLREALRTAFMGRIFFILAAHVSQSEEDSEAKWSKTPNTDLHVGATLQSQGWCSLPSNILQMRMGLEWYQRPVCVGGLKCYSMVRCVERAVEKQKGLPRGK